MISGVLFILFGEALLLLSRPHFMWALIFLAMNILVIPLVEEPGLRRRFGRPTLTTAATFPAFSPLRAGERRHAATERHSFPR